jgi:hypothetical protein
MPPTTPAMIPPKSGTIFACPWGLLACATPKHNGKATKKTTIDAEISPPIEVILFFIIINRILQKMNVSF